MRSVDGRMMVVPESVCSSCAAGNEHFVVKDEDALPLLSSGDRAAAIADLLSCAQAKMETAATERILALESAHVEEFDKHWQNTAEEVDATLEVDHTAQLPGVTSSFMAIPQEHARVPASELPPGTYQLQKPYEDPYLKTAHGSFVSQVHALWVKNARLQYRQRCSNCCSVFFVGMRCACYCENIV